ncbi:LytTr DNA-binding domain-containing protein [bacterium A37T11]|nr:LytTr DNA-binding domain-containing protein [bacterium A37T11]
MIHHTIRILDVLYPWEKKRSERVGLQLVLAVLLPCWLNKKLVEGLFIAFGQDFEKSGFMRFEIWVIFFGMLIYNFLYKDNYMEWLKNENSYFDDIRLPAPVMAEAPATILLPAPVGSISSPQDAFWGKNSLNERRIGFDEIAWIRSQESKRWLITLQGERFEIGETLDEAIRILNPGNYYRINRDYIVNCGIMIGFSYCSERNKESGNITYYKDLKFGNEQTGVEARRIPKDKERALRNLIHKNRDEKRNDL